MFVGIDWIQLHKRKSAVKLDFHVAKQFILDLSFRSVFHFSEEGGGERGLSE